MLQIKNANAIDDIRYDFEYFVQRVKNDQMAYGIKLLTH